MTAHRLQGIPAMQAVKTDGRTVSWWHGWWWRLDTLAGAIDYTPNDYLSDRMSLLEGGMREMRAELDALKTRDMERRAHGIAP